MSRSYDYPRGHLHDPDETTLEDIAGSTFTATCFDTRSQIRAKQFLIKLADTQKEHETRLDKFTFKHMVDMYAMTRQECRDHRMNELLRICGCELKFPLGCAVSEPTKPTSTRNPRKKRSHAKPNA